MKPIKGIPVSCGAPWCNHYVIPGPKSIIVQGRRCCRRGYYRIWLYATELRQHMNEVDLAKVPRPPPPIPEIGTWCEGCHEPIPAGAKSDRRRLIDGHIVVCRSCYRAAQKSSNRHRLRSVLAGWYRVLPHRIALRDIPPVEQSGVYPIVIDPAARTAG